MTKPSLKTRFQLALRESDLEGVTKGILFALSTYAKPDGSDCYPSTQTLATASGFSRRTVEMHLSKAEAAGWFIRHQDKFDGQKWANYTYQLTAKGCAGDSQAYEKDAQELRKGWESDDKKDAKEVPTNITDNITTNINNAFNRILAEIEGLILLSRINTVESLRAFKLQTKDNDPEILATAIIGFYQEQKNSDPQYVTGLAKVIREKQYSPFLNAKCELTKALSRELIDLVSSETITENQAYDWQARYGRGEVSDIAEFMPMPDNVTPIKVGNRAMNS